MLDTAFKYTLRVALLITLILFCIALIKVIKIANEPDYIHYRFNP